jgi:hypothetical protein
MDIEDYLGELLEHGAGEALTAVDLDAVLRESEREGMRLRRRRRSRMAIAAAAAVVGIAVGVGAAIDRFADPGHDETAAVRPASPSPASPSQSVPVATAATPTATAAASAPTSVVLNSVYAQKAVAMMAQLLPAGVTATYNTFPLDSKWAGSGVNMLINDGQDTATATLGVSTASPTEIACPGTSVASSADTGTGKRLPGALSAGCSVVNLADGGQEMNTVTEADADGYYEIIVTLTRADGTTVLFTVGNGVLGKGTAAVMIRPRPPLTVAQADQVAQSSNWQPFIVGP